MPIFTKTGPTSQVQGINETVLILHLDVAEEETIVSDLDPETQYTFTLLAVNPLGSDSHQVKQRTSLGMLGMTTRTWI